MSNTRRYSEWTDPRSRRSDSCENGRFKSHSRRYACNQSLVVDYGTPRQYLNFVWTGQIFWYSSSFGITWPSKLGVTWWSRPTYSLCVNAVAKFR